MTAASKLRIAVLFPELLGTYGDSGNATVLVQRALWRGIPATALPVGLTEPVPGSCDIYLLGGAEDDAQAVATERLCRSRTLRRAVDAGTAVLAVCAGLQVLGEWCDTGHERVAGLGLLDVRTTRLIRRAVGDVVTAPPHEFGLPPLVGFENHGGATSLGRQARPLAQVLHGVGNGDGLRTEGVVQGSVIASYLHGPLLALNPALADLLLQRATGAGALEPLPDHDIERARQLRLRSARRRGMSSGRRAGATDGASRCAGGAVVGPLQGQAEGV